MDCPLGLINPVSEHSTAGTDPADFRKILPVAAISCHAAGPNLHVEPEELPFSRPLAVIQPVEHGEVVIHLPEITRGL